jgi:hypothetical protein
MGNNARSTDLEDKFAFLLCKVITSDDAERP